MARVENWFGDWFDRHAQRHPRADWPRVDQKPEFYRGWIGNFVLHGVAEDVADEASVRLMADPPAHLGDHPKATLDLAKAIYRERTAAGKASTPGSREEADRASRECEDCGGHGLTVRWRKYSAGTIDEHGKVRQPQINLYCRCSLGRWLMANHRETAPEILRRIHDLQAHPWLWGPEYREPPGDLVPEPAEAF